MNINVAFQNQGILAWRAVAATNVNPPIDIRHHVNFGITFQAIDDLTADAVFEVQAAPADAADPCAPGAFHPVEEVVSCMSPWGALPATKSEVTIPAGTPKGTICTATLPCKPDAFIKVMAVSGDTGFLHVVVVLGGPR
ncbi:hypothetical protein [Bradyrhizobium neotropicale]|uniref:hypothetical protein n=1 Tax=Bradyrhizobium neotropicale TaxID=1497615 RepID=UPI001AD769F7|nr:hypothetical protein [Bradyrhizobium neotropicale]MBO4228440.1 hypothetical protein [Bradyrhizobium neotropicale]